MIHCQSNAKEVIVSRSSFKISRLPDGLKHLECYFRIRPQHVLIESNATTCPISVFCRANGQLVCSCPEAKYNGTCKHQQALENGLWARLADLPNRYGLLTCTEDWCQPRTPYTLALAAQPQAALELAGR